MTNDTPAPRRYGFALGLLTGACVGVGLGVWFVGTTASQLRRRMAALSRNLGDRTSSRDGDVSSSIGAAVGVLLRRGQDVRDDVAVSLARGAHDVAAAARTVEHLAMSMTDDRE